MTMPRTSWRLAGLFLSLILGPVEDALSEGHGSLPPGQRERLELLHRNALRLLKRDRSLAPCQEHLISLDDYYGLVGLKPMLAREEAYDKAATALVQKRAAE